MVHLVMFTCRRSKGRSGCFKPRQQGQPYAETRLSTADAFSNLREIVDVDDGDDDEDPSATWTSFVETR